MPSAVAQQQARRRAIAQILERNTIVRQTELVRLLRAEGLHATQSSVSRDLKDMGAAKLNSGYSLPEHHNGDNEQQLKDIAEFVRDIRTAGPNLLVITTAIGAAYLAGIGIDLLDQESITGHWALDQRFEPTMTPERRQKLTRDWKRAVERAKAWV